MDTYHGMKRARVTFARQVSFYLRVVDPEVYFVHSCRTAVQEHTGPLVRPYQLVLAALVYHDDSDMSARPREFPIPLGLTKDRAGKAFRLWCRIRVIRVFFIHCCHEFPRPVSSCRGNWSG